ncbi:MAG: hypothetical protein DRJ32_03680 [Thermoprotei archaeon]|nr:MAG: hypothetical protein DRJ32_03680 [Thermoprotei archaeon]
MGSIGSPVASGYDDLSMYMYEKLPLTTIVGLGNVTVNTSTFRLSADEYVIVMMLATSATITMKDKYFLLSMNFILIKGLFITYQLVITTLYHSAEN